MVAAVSLDYHTLRDISARTESYERRQKRERIRLTNDEAKPIRYVFSEWAGDVAGGSMWQAMLDADQNINVPHQASDMTGAERWCAMRRDDRDKILRCWRALCVVRTASQVTLYALYGERQGDVLDVPDVPWDRAVAPEYARLAKFTHASGGTTHALQTRLRAHVAKAEGEAPEAHAARLVAARVARRDTLSDVGAQCERLIVAATLDYRNAWAQSAVK